MTGEAFGTIFSPDRLYRYTLWRDWPDLFVPFPRCVNFICLNPSTATETVDDPTMRKCIKFCKSWGYQSMCVTNIFAFRQTSPQEMMKFPEPVGPDNDYWLKFVAERVDLVIAAWSQHGGHRGRSREVRALLQDIGKPVHILRMGTGPNPEPWHPLYLPDSSQPIEWVTI